MNICFVNTNFFLGGQQKVIIDVADGLSKYFNVFIYSFNPGRSYYEIKKANFFVDMSLSNLLLKDKLQRRIKKIFKRNVDHRIPAKEFSKRISNLEKFILEKKINVLILSGGFLTSFVEKIKSDIPSIKIICWQHSNAEIYLNKYYSDFKKEYVKGLRLCDQIICLTEEDLAVFKKINKKVKCLYNPVTIDNHETSTLKIKNISFAGRIAYTNKGIDYLIELASYIPKDWTISIAGDGSKEEVKRLLNDIEENNLESKIIYKGPLKGKELNEHFLNSSLFVMTSRWEGFGLVLTEAMSFGLPVIAFSQIGSREVTADGKYGVLVENGDIKQLNNEITRFTESYDLRKEYQKKSLERVEVFSSDIIINEWRKLLEEKMNV